MRPAAAVSSAIATPAIVVPEVVFADMGSSNRRDEGMTKAERKAFMVCHYSAPRFKSPFGVLSSAAS